MKRGITGHYVSISTVGDELARAFLPDPLPPVPPIEVDGRMGALLDQASTALGRLDGISSLLPEPHLFLYTYIRKEAVLSSQIEGTQSSLSDLLSHEVDRTPSGLRDDVMEVSCYVDAMEHGLSLLRDGMPISLRLIREIHGRLLAHARGSALQPGEFKRSQNWIGGTRPGNAKFVPAPPEETLAAMGALEKFLHDDPIITRPLLKAAMAHVQFETIHPFLDGNGRLGRLLITFILCSDGVLQLPMLYLSLYLKRHKSTYYELLQRVRTEGVWEEWIEFFLDGVITTSGIAVETAGRLLQLFQADRNRLNGESASVLRIHEHLQKQPVLSAAKVKEILEVSTPTAALGLKKLEQLGVVHEITGGKYGKVYAYSDYLAILNEE